ncbi:MAG: rod shape-determining protein MreC [Candidatus Algichlamydia australiensis]|nr:rod shape-determining protein MreC [Chlamydiales bacterium]
MLLPKWCNRHLLLPLILMLGAALPNERIAPLRMMAMGLASLPTKLQKTPTDKELLRLQAINTQLSSEVEKLYSYLLQQQTILSHNKSRVLSAKVLNRDLSPWSTTLWVDRGAQDGIKKNSVATVGSALLGIVDEVHKKKCRVRVITDPTLVPSVRAQRGEAQHRLAHSQIQTLLNTLPHLENLFTNSEEKEETLQHLSLLNSKLLQNRESLELAKGELHGSGPPLWRERSLFLRGQGFNYDHADEKGAARPLTGDILHVGDLLVTTGMDGLFPEGLTAGVVTKVAPLKEGDFSYDIEARMAVQNLDDLKLLHLLFSSES